MNSSYLSIDRSSTPAVYQVLDDLIARYHLHLATAKVHLLWRYGVTEDKDGHTAAGHCKVCSELDHELHGHDVVIWLNFELWGKLSESGRRAVLDHELCHAAEKVDKDGEPSGLRVRKHDLEEFVEIVHRHGLWREEVERLVAAGAPRLKQRKLFEDSSTQVDFKAHVGAVLESIPGVTVERNVEISSPGKKTSKRTQRRKKSA